MGRDFKNLALFAVLILGIVIFVSGCSITNKSPSAEFDPSPTSGDEPLVVTFDATSSIDTDGEVIDLDWDFGDGLAGSGRIVEHTYGQPGNYSVELTVTDDDGGVDTKTGTITVNSSNQEPDADFSVDSSSGEEPLDVQFDASNSSDPDGSIVSYSWDFGDGSTGAGLEAEHTFHEGTYVVTLTVRDDDGATDTVNATIEVTERENQPPTASFTADPTNGTAPLDVRFDAGDSSDPDGTIESYHWDFNEYTSEGSGEVTFNTFDYSGEFVVELTVTDEDGETATATKKITVERGDDEGGCYFEEGGSS